MRTRHVYLVMICNTVIFQTGEHDKACSKYEMLKDELRQLQRERELRGINCNNAYQQNVWICERRY